MIYKIPKITVDGIIKKGNEILLIRRRNIPFKNSWALPGGYLEYNEKTEDAVIREIFEETGIEVNKEKLKIISVTNDRVKDAHFVTIGFLCQDFKGEAKVMEPEEIIEWKWFDLDNLPSSIFFPSEKILKKFLAAKDRLN